MLTGLLSIAVLAAVTCSAGSSAAPTGAARGTAAVIVDAHRLRFEPTAAVEALAP